MLYRQTRLANLTEDPAPGQDGPTTDFARILYPDDISGEDWIRELSLTLAIWLNEDQTRRDESVFVCRPTDGLVGRRRWACVWREYAVDERSIRRRCMENCRGAKQGQQSRVVVCIVVSLIACHVSIRPGPSGGPRRGVSFL
jgi:hypothetical protein